MSRLFLVRLDVVLGTFGRNGLIPGGTNTVPDPPESLRDRGRSVLRHRHNWRIVGDAVPISVHGPKEVGSAGRDVAHLVGEGLGGIVLIVEFSQCAQIGNHIHVRRRKGNVDGPSIASTGCPA